MYTQCLWNLGPTSAKREGRAALAPMVPKIAVAGKVANQRHSWRRGCPYFPFCSVLSFLGLCNHTAHRFPTCKAIVVSSRQSWCNVPLGSEHWDIDTMRNFGRDSSRIPNEHDRIGKCRSRTRRYVFCLRAPLVDTVIKLLTFVYCFDKCGAQHPKSWSWWRKRKSRSNRLASCQIE